MKFYSVKWFSRERAQELAIDTYAEGGSLFRHVGQEQTVRGKSLAIRLVAIVKARPGVVNARFVEVRS